MNRPWLNGLCVAARVCLLYMLFDPDMISWRERGPGGAGLRTLRGPAPSFSLPRSPGPAALCPSPEPWAASSRTGLARRALCWGQRRGQAAGGGATFLLNVSPRILSGSPLRTRSLWPRLIGFRWALGSHPVGLNSPPSSRSDGLPSAQAGSQQRLAEGLGTVWQSSKAAAFSIQLYTARLPWPHCSAGPCPASASSEQPERSSRSANRIVSALGLQARVAPHGSGWNLNSS